MRSLLDAFNEANKTVGLTIVRMLVTGLVMALLAGACTSNSGVRKSRCR